MHVTNFIVETVDVDLYAFGIKVNVGGTCLLLDISINCIESSHYCLEWKRQIVELFICKVVGVFYHEVVPLIKCNVQLWHTTLLVKVVAVEGLDLQLGRVFVLRIIFLTDHAFAPGGVLVAEDEVRTSGIDHNIIHKLVVPMVVLVVMKCLMD